MAEKPPQSEREITITEGRQAFEAGVDSLRAKGLIGDVNFSSEFDEDEIKEEFFESGAEKINNLIENLEDCLIDAAVKLKEFTVSLSLDDAVSIDIPAHRIELGIHGLKQETLPKTELRFKELTRGLLIEQDREEGRAREEKERAEQEELFNSELASLRSEFPRITIDKNIVEGLIDNHQVANFFINIRVALSAGVARTEVFDLSGYSIEIVDGAGISESPISQKIQIGIEALRTGEVAETRRSIRTKVEATHAMKKAAAASSVRMPTPPPFIPTPTPEATRTTAPTPESFPNTPDGHRRQAASVDPKFEAGEFLTARLEWDPLRNFLAETVGLTQKQINQFEIAYWFNVPTEIQPDGTFIPECQGAVSYHSYLRSRGMMPNESREIIDQKRLPWNFGTPDKEDRINITKCLMRFDKSFWDALEDPQSPLRGYKREIFHLIYNLENEEFPDGFGEAIARGEVKLPGQETPEVPASTPIVSPEPEPQIPPVDSSGEPAPVERKIGDEKSPEAQATEKLNADRKKYADAYAVLAEALKDKDIRKKYGSILNRVITDRAESIQAGEPSGQKDKIVLELTSTGTVVSADHPAFSRELAEKVYDAALARAEYNESLEKLAEITREREHASRLSKQGEGATELDKKNSAELNNLIIDKFVFEERLALDALHIGEWPPEEKSKLQRVFAVYMKLPKPLRIAASTAIATGVALFSGHVFGAAALGYAAQRGLRAVVSGKAAAVAGAATNLGFESLDKTLLKKDTLEYKKAELRSNFDALDRLQDIADQYSEILARNALRERRKAAAVVLSSVVFGGLAGFGENLLSHHAVDVIGQHAGNGGAPHPVGASGASGEHAGGGLSKAGAAPTTPEHPLSVETPHTPASTIEVAKAGDSVWKMADRQLGQHAPGYGDLDADQKTWLISTITNKVVAEHPNYADHLGVTDKIDFNEALGNHDNISTLVEHAKNLTKAQLANIHNDNAEISNYVHEHPATHLNSSKVEEILGHKTASPTPTETASADQDLPLSPSRFSHSFPGIENSSVEVSHPAEAVSEVVIPKTDTVIHSWPTSDVPNPPTVVAPIAEISHQVAAQPVVEAVSSPAVHDIIDKINSSASFESLIAHPDRANDLLDNLHHHMADMTSGDWKTLLTEVKHSAGDTRPLSEVLPQANHPLEAGFPPGALPTNELYNQVSEYIYEFPIAHKLGFASWQDYENIKHLTLKEFGANYFAAGGAEKMKTVIETSQGLMNSEVAISQGYKNLIDIAPHYLGDVSDEISIERIFQEHGETLSRAISAQ